MGGVGCLGFVFRVGRLLGNAVVSRSSIFYYRYEINDNKNDRSLVRPDAWA